MWHGQVTKQHQRCHSLLWWNWFLPECYRRMRRALQTWQSAQSEQKQCGLHQAQPTDRHLQSQLRFEWCHVQVHWQRWRVGADFAVKMYFQTPVKTEFFSEQLCWAPNKMRHMHHGKRATHGDAQRQPSVQHHLRELRQRRISSAAVLLQLRQQRRLLWTLLRVFWPSLQADAMRHWQRGWSRPGTSVLQPESQLLLSHWACPELLHLRRGIHGHVQWQSHQWEKTAS